MARVNAKCPYCNTVNLVEDVEEAEICTNCHKAFITEKAIKAYNGESTKTAKKKRHIWKSLGFGLLMTVKCIAYLIYVFTMMWLFFDLVDDIRKK